MQLQIKDITKLKKRIAKTDGKLRITCQLAGITERVAYKLLAEHNILQQTFDKLMNGLEKLEDFEKEKKRSNSARITHRLLAEKLTLSSQPSTPIASTTTFKVIRSGDVVKPTKKKSIFADKQLAGDLMIARLIATREKAINRMREKQLKELSKKQQ